MKIQTRKNKTPVFISVTLVLLLLIGGYLSYAYTQDNLWPFKKETSTSDTPTLPKVKQDSNPPQQDTTTDESESTPSTQLEGKTPAQYEGDQPNDTPEYNNEQFRIPEGG